MGSLQRLIVVTFAAMLTGYNAAGCSKAQQPPTTPTATPESLTISGSQSISEGESTAFTATVRWSSGLTEVVSDGVTWASDDPRIASINERGVVTALAAGEVRIRATFRTISGMTTVSVAAGARTVTGRVHETRPTEDVRIPAASVTAVDSAGSTRTVVADGAGNFTMSLRPGPARFTVTAAGYETATATGDISGAGDALSFGLVPVLREVRVAFPYTYPPATTFVDQRRFSVKVHHAGELRAAFTGSWDTASAWALVCVEVRDASNKVVAAERGDYDLGPTPIRMSVRAGESYEVSFFACNGSRSPTVNILNFAGELKHPS